MDSVHQPNTKQFIGPRVNLREYFKDFSQNVAQEKEKCPKLKSRISDSNILKMMKADKSNNDSLDSQLFEGIKKVCDPANLSEAGEVPICQMSDCKIEEDDDLREAVLPRYTSADIPKAGMENLTCLALQQEFLDKGTTYDKEKRMRQARMHNPTWFETAPLKPSTIRKGAVENEVLVVIRIYKPTVKKSTTMEGTLGAYNHLSLVRYTQELHLLGSNTLDQLRDVIRCHHDHMLPGDRSEDAPWKSDAESLARFTPENLGHKFITKKKVTEKTTGELYKSGFFYIEGCFYNDMRHPENIDYSQVIRNWAEENPKRGIGPFTTSTMSGVRIDDLEVRFGYPYVYVHQGEHEHLFSFVEARLLAADDPQKLTDYPLERGVLAQRSKYCMVCSTTVASWVTIGNARLPENPYFFCDECFKEYNYDNKGQKVGDFKAFLYTDVNAI